MAIIKTSLSEDYEVEQVDGKYKLVKFLTFKNKEVQEGLPRLQAGSGVFDELDECLDVLAKLIADDKITDEKFVLEDYIKRLMVFRVLLQAEMIF